MILNDRQSEIIEILRSEKRASVTSLSKRLYVSEMTIRRDLRLLEDEGMIHRYNGGAVYADELSKLPIAMRSLLNAEEKETICNKTTQYLHNTISVFIDSSSTCSHIIPILTKFSDVTIITNSIQNLLIAAEHHIPCRILGGIYYEKDRCTVGHITDEQVLQYHIDIGFFSAAGLSESGDITDYDNEQTSVRLAAMKNCNKVIFLFDSSKLNQTGLFTLCNAKDVDEIITI